MYEEHTACLYDMEAAYACRTIQSNLWITATISWRLFVSFSYTETCSLRGSQTRTHERFHCMVSDTHMHLFPFSRAVLYKACQILVPDSAIVHCGQRYDLKAKLPGGGKFWKKNSKGDFKNLFWRRKILPIILNKKSTKRARKIGL